MSDLAAMLVVDAGITSRDDYLNLDAAAKVLPALAAHLAALKEATGLRNRLVHEYNGLDDGLALEAIRELVPAVDAFLAEVESWWTSQR